MDVISMHLRSCLSAFLAKYFLQNIKNSLVANGPSMVGPWVARWIHGSQLATVFQQHWWCLLLIYDGPSFQIDIFHIIQKTKNKNLPQFYLQFQLQLLEFQLQLQFKHQELTPIPGSLILNVISNSNFNSAGFRSDSSWTQLQLWSWPQPYFCLMG